MLNDATISTTKQQPFPPAEHQLSGSPLSADHWNELCAGSGLTPATITTAQFRTVSAAEAAEMANRPGFSEIGGDWLALPTFSADGDTLLYRVKPPPGTCWPGTTNPTPKYLQPHDVPTRVHFTPPRPGHRIAVIGEGEKKLWRAWQAGYWAIALPGVWNGCHKAANAGSKAYVLHEDLAKADFSGIDAVLVAFDTDAYAKSSVLHASAVLTKLLMDHGLNARQLWLPVGPDDANGMPGKMGLDDFAVMFGEAALREQIESAAVGDSIVSIEEYREQLRENRSRMFRGVAIDTSGVGTGKSYADCDLIAERNEKTLVTGPSHKLCEQIEKDLQKRGVDAQKYPKLTGIGDESKGIEPTCLNYDLASEIMSLGLSPSQTCCLDCEFRDECTYRRQSQAARSATVAICTTERAKLQLTDLAEGRKLITVQEQTANVLAPIELVEGGFDVVHSVSAEAYREAKNEKIDMHPDGLQWCLFRISENARRLHDWLTDVSFNGSVPLPEMPAPMPVGTQKRILQAMRRLGCETNPAAVSVTLAMTTGTLSAIYIGSDAIFAGKQQRQAIAVHRNQLPRDADVLVSDASTRVEQVRRLLTRPVVNITPRSTVANKKPVIQIAKDVLATSPPQKAVDLIRGVLVMYPSSCRVGLISHQCVVRLVKRLKGLNGRVVKASHFYGDASRGDNSWISECDLLLVLGTPRVPPAAIRSKILQLGLLNAVDCDPRWTGKGRTDSGNYGRYWVGRTLSGGARVVKTTGYLDHRWNEAFEAIVAAELEQSVGRSRAVLSNGIPCVVVSTLQVPGALLVDEDPAAITATDLRRLRCLATSPMTPTRAASQWDVSLATAKRWMLDFCHLGLINKTLRRDFCLTPSGNSILGTWTPCSSKEVLSC